MDRYSPTQRREYTNKWRSARKQEALDILGNKCVICGSEDDLQFDHIDPATKVMAIGSMFTSSRSKFDAEVKKCQLLCQSCHIKKSKTDGSLDAHRTAQHGGSVMYKKGCRCTLCKEYCRVNTANYRARKRAGRLLAKSAGL